MAAPLRAAADLEEHHGTLPDLDAIDGIVSFGGEASAWEPHNAPEAELIRAAVERELPYLGVCLGAQLLAHALGGTVSRLDRRMIAWTPLTVIAGDPVLGALPPGAHALHWNQDGIEPPPGATEIYARPPGGRAEGFRFRRAWGVQFHPEVDPPALDGWYAAWSDLLEPAGTTLADARAADALHLPGQAALAAAIFGAFAREVARGETRAGEDAAGDEVRAGEGAAGDEVRAGEGAAGDEVRAGEGAAGDEIRAGEVASADARA